MHVWQISWKMLDTLGLKIPIQESMWSRNLASIWQKGSIKAFGDTKSSPNNKNYLQKKMVIQIKAKTLNEDLEIVKKNL